MYSTFSKKIINVFWTVEAKEHNGDVSQHWFSFLWVPCFILRVFFAIDFVFVDLSMHVVEYQKKEEEEEEEVEMAMVWIVLGFKEL